MTSKDTRNWIVGPVCAVATPFKEDFSPDYGTFRSNIRRMIDHGMKRGDGVLLVVAGGGEFAAISTEERKAYMDVAIEAADGQVPLITSIQHTDVRAIYELAQYAEKIGINAAQLGSTYYWHNTAADYHYLFESVAKESSIPLVAYYLATTAENVPLSILEEIADIPTVGGIKWSAVDNLKYRKSMLKLQKSVAIINNGGDTIIGHMNGIRAFTTQVSNFWPEYIINVWRLLEQRDYIAVNKTLSEFYNPWREWCHRAIQETAGEGPFIKASMELAGLHAGPPRPPSRRLSKALTNEMRELFARVGILRE